MNRTILTPLLVLSGIVLSCALMAATNLFDPLIRFIHTGVITPIQAAICLVFTIGGFALYFYLLNLICSYFVPRIDTDRQSRGVNLQTEIPKGGLKQQ